MWSTNLKKRRFEIKRVRSRCTVKVVGNSLSCKPSNTLKDLLEMHVNSAMHQHMLHKSTKFYNLCQYVIAVLITTSLYTQSCIIFFLLPRSCIDDDRVLMMCKNCSQQIPKTFCGIFNHAESMCEYDGIYDTLKDHPLNKHNEAKMHTEM